MIKVLLADDNPLILERFTNMIDWRQHGFEIVSAAIDGKRAWNDFQAHRPELVITDIQMPKMTGIELAAKIVEANPYTFILFLTSYEEFSYVKSALDLGVYGYLLKHETERDKLVEVLEGVSLEMKKRRLHTKYTAEAPLHALIHDMDNNRISEEAFYEYEISLPDRYDLLLIEQDHIYPAIGELFDMRTAAVNENTLKKTCYDGFPSLAAVIQTDEYRYVALLKSGGSVAELAYDIKKELSQRFQVTFSVMIFAENAPILICAEQYAGGRGLIRQKYFNPKSSVAHAGYLRKPQQPGADIDTQSIGELMKNGRFDEIIHRMDQQFISAIETRDFFSFDRLTRYYAAMLRSYHNKIINSKTGAIFKAYDDASPNSWYDANSVFHWMKHSFVELCRELSNLSSPQYSEVIQRVVEFINSNYTNSDLSVDLIAEHLKMNSSRLNARVKKETGETIWKLIIKVRMDKARDLLNVGRDKVTDICLMTGYKDISYFSKVFKDTYGMTPLEYRRNNNEI